MYYLTANYYCEVRIILYLYLFIHTYIYHLTSSGICKINYSGFVVLFDNGGRNLERDFSSARAFEMLSSYVIY